MRFFDAFPFEYFYYYSTAFQKSKKNFLYGDRLRQNLPFHCGKLFPVKKTSPHKGQLLTLEMQAGGAAYGIYGKEKAFGAFTG